MPSIPIWLQLLLGVFDIVAPELAWLNPIIVLLYEVFTKLPWFKKAAFIVEWRKMVVAAKAQKSDRPLKDMHARWAGHVGVPMDLVN